MKEWPIIDVDLMATMTGGLRSNVCAAVDRSRISVDAYCCQLDSSKTVSGIPGAVHLMSARPRRIAMAVDLQRCRCLATLFLSIIDG